MCAELFTVLGKIKNPKCGIWHLLYLCKSSLFFCLIHALDRESWGVWNIGYKYEEFVFEELEFCILYLFRDFRLFFFISVPMRVAFDTLKIFFFMPLRSRTDEALFFTDFVLCIMLNSSCLFSEKEHLIVSIIQKLWYLRICNFFQFCWKFMSGHPSCSVEKWEGTCTIT